MNQTLQISNQTDWSFSASLKTTDNSLNLEDYEFVGGFYDQNNLVLEPECTFIGNDVVLYLSSESNNFNINRDLTADFKLRKISDGSIIQLYQSSAEFRNYVQSSNEKEIVVKNHGTFYTYYECKTESGILDLTGYKATCRFRMSKESLVPVVIAKNFPHCFVKPEIGTVIIVLSVQQTPLLPLGNFWYDVTLSNGTDSFILVQGNLKVID